LLTKLENERFNKDFAAYEKARREQEKQKRELALEQHKIQALERDATSWEKMEELEKKAEAKQEFKRNVLQQGKRNMNG
jgi:hypothetical protein